LLQEFFASQKTLLTIKQCDNKTIVVAFPLWDEAFKDKDNVGEDLFCAIF